MRALLLILAAILGVSWLALQLIERGGILQLQWGGYAVETSVPVAVGGAFLASLLLVFVFWLIISIVRLPYHLRQRRFRQRTRQGLAQLAEGFAALAATDYVRAGKLANKASQLLDGAPVTLMLRAQLAEKRGDRQQALTLCREMRQHRETEFLGLRGELTLARTGQDPKTALELAEQAHKLLPKSRPSVDTLLELHLACNQWQEASQVIDRARQQKVLTREQAKHYHAIVHYLQAQRLFQENSLDSAGSFAETAHKSAPDFIMAAVLYSRILAAQNRQGKALKVIEQSWKHAPHPEMLACYRLLLADEKPEKQLQSIEKLARLNPKHRESQMAIAEASIAAQKWEKARNHLKALLAEQETARVCTLMAKLEEAEKKDPAISAPWFQRAAVAEADPVWQCETCYLPAAEWSAYCRGCGGFDTIRWSDSSRLSPALPAEPSADGGDAGEPAATV